MISAEVPSMVKVTREPLVRRVPWYPVVLTTAFIVNLYVESGVSHFVILRPLLVAVTATALLVIFASALVRNRHLGAIITGLVLVLMAGWHSPVLLGVAGILTVAAVALIPRTRWAGIVSWPGITRVLNVTSLFLFVAIGIKAVQVGTPASLIADMRQGGPLVAATTPVTSTAPPDIYLVMLDGYPRADLLARSFGTDNGAFVTDLRERGFEVAERNRSNYSQTVLTLTSMFNMRLLEDIDGVAQRVGTAERDQPLLRILMNDASAFDVLRAHGYEIAATSSGYENAVLRQADIYLDSGELNEFEDTLIQATSISWVLNITGWDVIGDQQRSRIRHEFDLLRDLGSTPSSRPRFAFVHVPAPHPPLVFGKDGAPIKIDLTDWFHVAPILADERRAFVERYRGGLEYLNGLVLDAIDDVIAAAPPGREPVIVVFSDHGSKWNLDDEVAARLTERVSNFFAARTPGHQALFSDHITPVNVLPTLLDAYLGTDLPRSPDRNLITAGTNVFELTEIPNVDAGQGP